MGCIQSRPQLAMAASPAQKGWAEEYIDSGAKGRLRRDLNYIKHSKRPAPKYGHNRFADTRSEFDPEAQKVLDRAKRVLVVTQ